MMGVGEGSGATVGVVITGLGTRTGGIVGVSPTGVGVVLIAVVVGMLGTGAI